MRPSPRLFHPLHHVCRFLYDIYGFKNMPFMPSLRSLVLLFLLVVSSRVSMIMPSLFISPCGHTILYLYTNDMIITGDDPAHIQATLIDSLRWKILTLFSTFWVLSYHNNTPLTWSPELSYSMSLLLILLCSFTRSLRLVSIWPILLYWDLVGPLVYFTISRPDIAYVVHIINLFVQTPILAHYMTSSCSQIFVWHSYLVTLLFIYFFGASCIVWC